MQAFISIHALLAESDNFRRAFKRPVANFYPRSPCGERHNESAPNRPEEQFLSTLSLRRATRRGGVPCYLDNIISIHALLAESDSNESSEHTNNSNFYPRSPCGERQTLAPKPNQKSLFLSTLSLRRATAADISARREASISIHALLAESDVVDTVEFASSMLFLSTLSLRRATREKSK